MTHCGVLYHRRLEQLESQVPVDRESPATLPITEGSRASSHSSIEALPPSTLLTHHRATSPHEDGEVCMYTKHNLLPACISNTLLCCISP